MVFLAPSRRMQTSEKIALVMWTSFWNTSHLKLLDFFIDVQEEHDQWIPTNAFDIEQSSSKCTNNIRCT